MKKDLTNVVLKIEKQDLITVASTLTMHPKHIITMIKWRPDSSNSNIFPKSSLFDGEQFECGSHGHSIRLILIAGSWNLFMIPKMILKLLWSILKQRIVFCYQMWKQVFRNDNWSMKLFSIKIDDRWQDQLCIYAFWFVIHIF